MNAILKPETMIHHSAEYKNFLNSIKTKIRSARLSAALAVNQELILLYWNIGREIIKRDGESNWGEKLIEILSKDLKSAFPETSGFSPTNLKRMRRFAQNYPDLQIGPHPVAQLPWGHISVLIHKIKDTNERDWYIYQAINQGWSRILLEKYINEGLHKKQAISSSKTSNYLDRLPHPQSELAHELLKQPYNFDFLGLHDDALEREIEHASISHIMKFLLELGKGFAFVGRQVPIMLQENEYFFNIVDKIKDWHLFTLVLDKHKLKKKINNLPKEHRIYNYLSIEILKQIAWDSVKSKLLLIVDKRKGKPGIRDFNKYLSVHLEAMIPLNVKYDIVHEWSHSNPALQAVDLFCWGVRRFYEYGDETWFSLYRKRLTLAEANDFSGIKKTAPDYA